MTKASLEHRQTIEALTGKHTTTTGRLRKRPRTAWQSWNQGFPVLVAKILCELHDRGHYDQVIGIIRHVAPDLLEHIPRRPNYQQLFTARQQLLTNRPKEANLTIQKHVINHE